MSKEPILAGVLPRSYRNTDERLDKLDRFTVTIAHLVEAIKEITYQTNLRALRAAIGATRDAEATSPAGRHT